MSSSIKKEHTGDDDDLMIIETRNIQTEPGPSHSGSAVNARGRPPSKTRLIDSIGSLSISLLPFNYKLRLNEAVSNIEQAHEKVKRAADEILLGDDGLIELWDISQGELEQTLLHPESAFSMAFSLDGQKLASATGRGTIKSGISTSKDGNI